MQNEPKVTDIFYRNTGEIRGSLSGLQPFLLLAKTGISHAERTRRISERSKGRFIISQIVNKGAAPKHGLLLPVARCGNETMMSALLDLRQYLVSEYQYHRAKETRKQAQRLLNRVFGENIKIHPRASLDGFVELERSKGLFPILTEYFEYVEALRDDPKGVVEPISYRRFAWPSYGQFLEWFYEGVEPGLWGWFHCNIYLVFDKVCLLRTLEFGKDRIEKQSLDLSRYFRISNEITSKVVSVTFEMREYGWVYLHVGLDESAVKLRLSDVYPPFGELLSWLKMLDRCDIPAQFHVDEEGEEKTIASYSTNDIGRVLFRIVDRYSEEVFVEGIVDRVQLVECFRTALLTFFKDQFNPAHWRDYDDDEEETSDLKEIMLGDPWLTR